MKENVVLGSFILTDLLTVYYLFFGNPNMYYYMKIDNFSVFRMIVCVVLIFIVIFMILIGIYNWAVNIDRKRNSKRHNRRRNNGK